MENVKYLWRLLLIVTLVSTMSAGVAQAEETAMQELRVDTIGIPDYDERGETSNAILEYYVGPNASIISLKWDVNVTSYVGSYLSEMKVTFSDTSGTGITFTPGDGDDFDGTMDYAGFQDFRELGLVFKVGTDGILRLEFHDGFKDLAFDEPEGIWNSGTLVFGIAPVPEPSGFAMVLVGLLCLSYGVRRTRSQEGSTEAFHH